MLTGMVWRHGGAFGGTCFGFTQPRLPSGGHRRTEVRGSTDGAVSGSAGLVIGFALLVHDQRISLAEERQEIEKEGRRCSAALFWMIMVLTSTFSLRIYRIFLLSFDARCHVLLIDGGMLVALCLARLLGGRMARNKTDIEFAQLVAWPLLE